MKTTLSAGPRTGPAREDDFTSQRFCTAAPDPKHTDESPPEALRSSARFCLNSHRLKSLCHLAFIDIRGPSGHLCRVESDRNTSKALSRAIRKAHRRKRLCHVGLSFTWIAVVCGFVGFAGAATPSGPGSKKSVPVDVAVFNRDVKPVLENNCSGCHNSIVMSGGANLLPYTESATLQTERDMWEKIARRVQSGGMPPKDAPRPPQEKLDAMVKFIQAYFDKVDSGR